jgi:hypothetical protein
MFARQAVFFPSTLLQNRVEFEEGMDLALQVLTLGTMPKLDRQRRIAAKWVEILDSIEE